MIDVGDMFSVRVMSEMSDRLRDARIDAGYKSAAAAAEALGVNPSTYRAHENGQNEYSMTEATHYGRKFRVNPIWLFTGVKPDPQLEKVGKVMAANRTIPNFMAKTPEIETRAGAGGGGVDLSILPDNISLHERDAVRSWWELPESYLAEIKVRRSGARIIEVTGDSMYDPQHPGAPGSIFPGDRLIIDIEDRRPSPPGAFAVYDGLGLVVKMVEVLPNTDPPRIRMISRNPQYSSYEVTSEEAHIIGRVRGKISIL